MKCPYCGKDNTRVIDSRSADDGDSIRRRRECDECHKRFTTYEKVETIPMIVIKKDNNRETYDRAKIEGGVFSCLLYTSLMSTKEPSLYRINFTSPHTLKSKRGIVHAFL